ncbi:transglutaminase family protein [Devosia sp.]|uniref:transglutaminase family protein n=1 Tax=Devosia sp. TaxID=1871048 RepID=UPI003A95454C
MDIKVRQTLSLGLGEDVARSLQHLLLTPRAGPTQSVKEWSIDLPGLEDAVWFTDAYGNSAHLVSQVKPDPELVITIAGVVDTIDRNGVLGKPPGEPVPALFMRSTPLTKPMGLITQKFRSSSKLGPDRIALLHALMDRVKEVLGSAEDEAPKQSQSQSQDGQSQSQSQEAAPPPEEAPAEEAKPFDPVAHAHAFIGAARALGIPARFVTGYLADDAMDGTFHAWAEAYDTGLGWIAFDPSLGYCPTDRHVRMAVGLDATSATPVRSVPSVGEPAVLAMQIEAVQ